MSTETDIATNATQHGKPGVTEADILDFIHDVEHAAAHLAGPEMLRFALFKLRQASYAGTFP